jgi:hypothetical protein
MTRSALTWSRADVGSFGKDEGRALEDQVGECDALLLATIAAIRQEPCS